MKKHHYKISIAEIDVLLYAKAIENENIQNIINVLLEHEIDMESFHYVATVEYKANILDSQYQKCLEQVNLIFNLMEK